MDRNSSAALTDRRRFLQALGASGLSAGGLASNAAAGGLTGDCTEVRLEADETELGVGEFTVFSVVAADGCEIEAFELEFVTPQRTAAPETLPREETEKAARRFGSAGTFAAFAAVTIDGSRVLTNTVIVEVTSEADLAVDNGTLSVAADRRAAIGTVDVTNSGPGGQVVEVELVEARRHKERVVARETVLLAGDTTRTITVSAFTDDEFGDLSVRVNGTVEAREAGGTFEVVDIYAPDRIDQGDEITLWAKIANTGRREGTRTITYRFDGDDADATERTLEPGEATFAAFQFQPDVAPGTYTHSVTTGDDTKSAEIEVAGDALEINFQPADARVPDGAIPDTGERFGDRNGQRYGWSQDHTDTTRDRDDHDVSQALNTFNHFTGNDGTTDRSYRSTSDPEWEIELDDGTYEITLVGGDADNLDNELSFAVNDTLFIDEAFDSERQRRPRGDHFVKHEGTVEVTDGTLTIAPPDGAFNPKICYLSIRKQLSV
jgi:hypothetical protein